MSSQTVSEPEPERSSVISPTGGQRHSDLPQKEQDAGTASPAQTTATVAPADHVLTLVSSCVVNQRAFANTCGVPLGAHMDFIPSSLLRLPQISRPPLRCNVCSGFLNMYCKTNLLKWVWKCNMCGGVNIDKEQLGRSADTLSYPELCSEAVEYVQPLPETYPRLPPLQQPHHLVFAVDTSMEPGDLQAVKEALLSTLTGSALLPTTLISLLTFDGCVAVHNLGTLRCSHVLPAAPPPAAGAADGSVALDHQAAVQQLLDRHCTATAARRRGGGAAGGAAVEGRGAGAAPDSVLVSELGSAVAQVPKVLASLRTVQGDVPLRARARCLCSAVEAGLRLIAAAASLDLTRHHNLYGSRVVVLAAGPATRGPGAVPLELLDQAVPEQGRSQDNKAVAAALDVGLALGSMASKIGVAVDIFTSTATGINARLLTAITHGSGGELMPQQTAPHHPPYVPTHPHPHPQPQPTSPNSPHHETQSAQTAPAGAGCGLECRTGGFIGPLLSRQLVAALGRRFGVDARLDCYCSEGLRLVQWMGPLDPLRVDLEAGTTLSGPASPPPSPSASSATSGGALPPRSRAPSGGGAPSGPAASLSAAAAGPSAAWRLSSAACGVVALEAGRCASLRLEVTRDLEEVPTLMVQVALHWIDPLARCRVVRVVSRRLAVVESRGEFLRTVNPTAAAALLGKKAVLDAKKAGAFRDARRAEEARYAVAAQLGLVATRCGPEVAAGRGGVLGFGARKLRQWPPELMPLAYALYHFQRGPVLGPPAPPPPGTFPAAAHAHLHGLWDSDARLVGINSLLWSAWGDAYRAMAPKLYAVLPPPAGGAAAAVGPQLAALPCVTLAAVMARTVPLLLDVGTAVMVTPTEEPDGSSDGAAAAAGGGGLTPVLLEAAMLAAGCAGGGGRVPVPSVVLAPGAQAGGGALAARLIPCHRDQYEEQALQHPQLQQLGPAVAAQLSKQLVEEAEVTAAAAASAAAAAGLPRAQAKQAVAAAASFAEWCRTVHVQPFPIAVAPGGR